MWINPKFKDQYQPQGPPEDEGRRLATLPRGEAAELRVTLADFKGRPFVARGSGSAAATASSGP